MNKRIPALATGAMFVAFGFGAAPASADSVPCGTPATDAVYKTEVTPGTEPVYDQIKVIDVAYVPAVPGVPAVEEVSHMETRIVTPAVPGTDAVYDWVKVIDVEAEPEVPGTPEVPEQSHFETKVITPAVEGQHYSLKGSSKLGKDEVPETPEVNPEIWQANTHDEPNGHYVSADDDGTEYVDGESGLHFTSHGPDGEGNRDWFYFKAGTPAVTEQVKVIDVAYQPAVPGTPAVEEVSHLEWQIVKEATDGTPAVTEEVKVIDVAYVPAVPEVPAVEEVSHMETILVKPGTGPTSSTVLVSEATPAGDPCAIPTSARSGGPTSLAQTGSDAWIPVSLGGALLLAGAVMVGAARKRETV